MKALVVDDSRATRIALRRALVETGYEVVEAEDGTDALVKVAESRPAVVLSCWDTPEMSGIDLLRALRAAGNDVPVGLVATEATAEMRELATAAGALFLLAAPVTAEDIRRSLPSA